MMLRMIIPVKGLAVGKTRLSAILSPTERADLNRRFLRHTLDVAAVTPGLAEVIVVTRDAEARDMARAKGAATLDESGGGELNAALGQACDAAIDAGADAILVLPTDLPLLTPDDVAAVIAGAPGVVIAPDRRGTGTNALYLSPPGILSFRFGPGSFAVHTAAAEAAGAAATIVRRPNIAFDIDTPDDYREWVALAGEPG